MAPMAGGRPSGARRRVVAALTFWLRPAFALRVVNRFQRIAGFDRAMALASSALTALVPLVLLVGALLSSVVDQDVAERLVERYGLTGAGADAVDRLFSPAGDTSAGVGVFGVVFLVISVLSFARASQRLFEQAWELKPLGVRNSRNGLWWILGLGAYGLVEGGLAGLVGGGPRSGLLTGVVQAPVTAVFLVWTGWILSAKRIAWRELIPFGVTATVMTTLYSWGAALYLPHLFNTSVSRYGVVGAVFALLSALFTAMLALVGSAAWGREVTLELDRIRSGLRPSEHEVRRQWDTVVEQTRSRWRSARHHVSRRGNGKPDR